jgi:hypothetical protein
VCVCVRRGGRGWDAGGETDRQVCIRKFTCAYDELHTTVYTVM